MQQPVGIKDLILKYYVPPDGFPPPSNQEEKEEDEVEVDGEDEEEDQDPTLLRQKQQQEERQRQQQRLLQLLSNTEASQKRGIDNWLEEYKCHKCQSVNLKYLHSQMPKSEAYIQFKLQPINNVEISSVCKSVLKHDLIMAYLKSPNSVFEIFGFKECLSCGHNQYTQNFTLSNCRVNPKTKYLLCKDCSEDVQEAIPPLDYIERYLLPSIQNESKITTFFLLKHHLACGSQPLVRGTWRNLILGNSDGSFVTELLVELSASDLSPYCPCDELEYVLSSFFPRRNTTRVHFGYSVEEMVVFDGSYLYIRLKNNCHMSNDYQYNSLDFLNKVAETIGVGKISLNNASSSGSDGNNSLKRKKSSEQDNIHPAKKKKKKEKKLSGSNNDGMDALLIEIQRIKNKKLQQQQQQEDDGEEGEDEGSIARRAGGSTNKDGNSAIDSLLISQTKPLSKRNNADKGAISTTKKSVISLRKAHSSYAPGLNCASKIIIREPTLHSKSELCEPGFGKIQFKEDALSNTYHIQVKLLKTADEKTFYCFPKSNIIIPPPLIQRTNFNTFNIIHNVYSFYDNVVERNSASVNTIDQQTFYRSIVALVNQLKQADVNEREIRFRREVPADLAIPFTREENEKHRLNPETIQKAIWNMQEYFTTSDNDSSKTN